jgi:predicted nucleic acid-binding protein
MNANFVDTNVIIYSLSDVDEKRLTALKIIASKPVISAQVLNETANTLQRKLKFSPQTIHTILTRLIAECDVVAIQAETSLSAIIIMERYRFSFYDSLIIATALAANCTTLYSEDMQHAQLIENKLSIVNPFIGATKP